tara:strand:- start:1579 stop:2586 length:1008 start_codon:yes stop_codon:yes gene_type:complete
MLDKIRKIILEQNTSLNAIWLMRQAGRYLPEFREIRKKNPNFIELCLNKKLVPEITLQPLKRFELDGAIIFSDILMVPYGMGQKVEFKKDFGPILGELNIKDLGNENQLTFESNLKPVYESMKYLSDELNGGTKSLIGFVGALWTILVYMLNKQSPKKKIPNEIIYEHKNINDLIEMVIKYIKIHISQQVNSGAQVIQIFDSWAGLVDEKHIGKFIYEPTKELVEFIKNLGVPVICFPREIKNYKKYVTEVRPSAINIDYNVDPKDISNTVNIPVQGGLNPSILLSDKEKIKKEAGNLLEIFKNHPYIFNLGHGVLPQTDPNMVEYLVKFVKDKK